MLAFSSVAFDENLGEVGRALANAGTSQLPVLNDGEIAGYVGETELARAYTRALHEED